ncbi:AAA family ATPase [Candidatus Peregrinibacteria bacterium]|jgi:DNA polymerase III subunit delta'|nr:AAA family ATPase [Candidatus Peregrinibacteria bacterium]
MHNYNWQLAGHEIQRSKLENDMNTGNLAHAYLFHGPTEVGKFTLAKTFANILQCNEGLCGKCPTCLQINNDCHYDTFALKEDGTSVKIEQVQKIIAKLSTTSQANYKIVMIEDIERLTLPAANCLLKTLEEPGERTIFLLTTNDITNVLDTIKSRSRLLKFAHVSNEELEAYLEERGIPVDEQTERRAKMFAFGSIGKFFRLIKSQDDLNEIKDLYDMLVNLLEGGSISAKFAFVKQVSEDKIKSKKMLEMLTHLIRSMLLAKTGYSSHLGELPELLSDFSASHLLSLLERIESAKRDLAHNVNTKLLLENLFLETT